MLCPCRKCLIEPVCKTSCDDFDKFITPIARFVQYLGKVCEWMDGYMEDDSTPEKLFRFFGTKILDPVIFFVFKYGFRIKIHRKETWLFDERYEHWEHREEANN